MRACEYDEDRIVMYFHDGSDVRWADAMVDVVVPPGPEPAPEPAGKTSPPWPEAPVIRVTLGWLEYTVSIDGLLAFRTGDDTYTVPGVGDVIRGRVGDGIVRWEDMTCLPARTLTRLGDHIQAHDEAFHRGVSSEDLQEWTRHIVDVARVLTIEAAAQQEAEA
ncbi:hypothetical protein CWT12_06545 [Actinomyces sp. 432]|uniref:hypothetical protein n=1 Tax=Actinomyces sp. 432 TaxID=2057798 RepID=UPI0013745098|nr:hypothetical protein [Actinomyces sp. 432]QHO91047.1 hypothetical protein CWT12_06545 [Actinomyces sp. 432]